MRLNLLVGVVVNLLALRIVIVVVGLTALAGIVASG